MLASQRRQAIMAGLSRSGAVRVADLTTKFDVSDMTVRRDLELLEEQGRLRRVHGGAVATSSSAEEPGFEAKRLIAREAKLAIVRRAAELVEPRSAIGISAGTTTWLLAEELRQRPGPLSVVTNSTSVADALAEPARYSAASGSGGVAAGFGADVGHSVILTGGLRTPSAALVGTIADRAIKALHVDLLFLGVHGMDLGAGLTTPNLAEAHTNAAFIAHAKRLVVLADSSKWAMVGLATIAPLSAVDILITDDGISDDARTILTDSVGELIVVPAEQAGA